jgi:hypothetical protein
MPLVPAGPLCNKDGGQRHLLPPCLPTLLPEAVAPAYLPALPPTTRSSKSCAAWMDARRTVAPANTSTSRCFRPRGRARATVFRRLRTLPLISHGLSLYKPKHTTSQKHPSVALLSYISPKCISDKTEQALERSFDFWNPASSSRRLPPRFPTRTIAFQPPLGDG